MNDRLELEIENNLAALGEAAERVRDFLQGKKIGGRAGYAVDLALEELGGNIIRYAHGEGGIHSFRFAVECQEGAIALTLEDEGAPFDPTAEPPPAAPGSLEEARIGGLGIDMVRKSVERMEYRRTERGNRLDLRIAAGGGERK